MRILAFNVTHDSSVCSLNNGKIEFFCKEERISRVKRDKNPIKSLELFLSNNSGKIDSFVWSVPTNNIGESEGWYGLYLAKRLNKNFKFNSIGHHLSHATLAFVNSKFEEALVVVIDRDGTIIFINGSPVARESESVYMFSKTEGTKPIHKSYWLYNPTEYRSDIRKFVESQLPGCYVQIHNPYSIVKVYEAATTLIGQNPLENGKTMGLSSYGQEVDEPLFDQDVPISSKFETLRTGEVCFSDMEELIQRDLNQDNYQFYADKAKQVQSQTQEVALNLIRKYVELTGINNVCLVGGYALNVVANNYYIKNLPEVNFYFEPTADDTGVPIGAAMIQYYRETKEWAEPLEDNFYQYYDPTEKLEIGQKSNLSKVVKLLNEGKSVAIFEGAPEAGPRALGHRSILFDARDPDTKNIVNQIKRREWYRPFAGVILEEEFENYFETLELRSSPYMTINFDAKEHTKKLVPGVVHVDGTCRVQTVSNGTLYEILKLFHKKTKCPILLNTSFNLAGEALAQTKQDAINTFENSSLDALFFVDDGKLLVK